MRSTSQTTDFSLVGVGLYTPAEAGRLIGIRPSRLSRWLCGHHIGGRRFTALWQSQVDLQDGTTHLGFLDLVQARVAAALVREGLSAHKVRQAIDLTREILSTEHPFASARFKTDGKTLLVETLVPGEDDRLIDLFQGGQYVLRQIIEPSLRGIEFDFDMAARWWPTGRRSGIVLDPARQFGRPIEAESGIPTAILAEATLSEGSEEAAGRAFDVPIAAVRHALAFERRLAA